VAGDRGGRRDSPRAAFYEWERRLFNGSSQLTFLGAEERAGIRLASSTARILPDAGAVSQQGRLLDLRVTM